MGKYSTPRVPHETPMYEVTPEGRQVLSRTWMIFFERLGRVEAATGGTAAPFDITDLYWRTLLLKDTAVGDDIADHVPAQATGIGVKLVGVLRKEIEEDLTVRVNKELAPFIILTIPAGTLIDTPVEQTTFVAGNSVAEGEVLWFDVTESDGQVDAAGVASFTLYMQKTTTITP